MGEDYYEQDHGHYDDPRFFFRWLFWSWLFSGGSANYCGRWGTIDPYSLTADRDRPWQGISCGQLCMLRPEVTAGACCQPFLQCGSWTCGARAAGTKPRQSSLSDVPGRASLPPASPADGERTGIAPTTANPM